MSFSVYPLSVIVIVFLLSDGVNLISRIGYG